MTTIKLNNYYPHLTECITLEVSEEIAVTLSIGGRLCDSYKRRKREHDECSLDGPPGFESDVTRPPLTPEEIMEQTEERDNLYTALDQLPPVQARRVYAHYILGKSKSDIARAENVSENAVRDSISRGMEMMKNILKKFFYPQIAGNGTSKKGDFQNGTATDSTQKTESIGEGEESQCGACQGSA